VIELWADWVRNPWNFRRRLRDESSVVEHRIAAGLLSLLQWACCLWIVTVLVAWPKDAVAWQGSGEITQVAVGLGQRFKPGHWTPVRVTLISGDQSLVGRLRLTTLDSDGVPVHYVTDQDISIASGESGVVTGYVRFGSLNPRLTVSVIAEDQVVLERTLGVGEIGEGVLSTDYLIVTFGESLGVEEATHEKLNGAHAYHAASVTAASELPLRWEGYDAIDVVAIGTSDLSALESLSEKQVRALQTWVALGGRLMISGARHANDVFRSGGLFEEWSPGELQRVSKEVRTSDVANYLSAAEELEPFDVAVISAIKGNVQAFVDSSRRKQRPLVTHYPYRLGAISYLTVDLDREPFASWSPRAELVARVLRVNEDDNDLASSSSTGIGKVSHIGYDDVVGQVRATLDQFRNARPIAFSLIATLIGVYILLIGPGDFFFLKKVIRQMHWSWLTFPAIVLSFSALSLWLWQLTRDTKVKVNQLEVIDLDVESQLVRGTTWAHCYSPRADVYSLGMQIDDSLVGDAKVLLAWQGLPGDTLGGLDATSLRPALDFAYTIDVDAESEESIQQLPLNVSSTKSLVGQWHGSFSSDSEFALQTNRNGELLGRFRYELPYELEEGLLFYQNNVYPLKRTLDAGQVVEMAGLSPKKLKSQLQSVRGMTVASAPYDAAATDDVPRLLDVMTFYDLAGGRSYANLSHRYQTYVDLSSAVRNGRAVLVGRCARSVSRLVREGDSLESDYDQQWTFVRVVIPVSTKSETEDGAL